MTTPAPSPASAPEPARPGRGVVARLQALRQRRAGRLLTDGLLVLLVLAAAGLWQTRGHLPAGAAPEVTLPSLDGPPVALSSLRGRPVLLAFWAPWCGVCKADSDNLARVARLAGDRARVVTVAAAYGDLEEVREYVRAQGLAAPVLLGDDALLRAFRVEAFPTVYVLDGEGRVRRSAVGYTTTAGLLWRLLLP